MDDNTSEPSWPPEELVDSMFPTVLYGLEVEVLVLVVVVERGCLQVDHAWLNLVMGPERDGCLALLPCSISKRGEHLTRAGFSRQTMSIKPDKNFELELWKGQY